MSDQDLLTAPSVGTPPAAANRLGVLADLTRDVGARAQRLGDELLGPTASDDAQLTALAALAEPARTALKGLAAVGDKAEVGTLTVALMGRTMAGKSTLLEALTGGDGLRQGIGAQRTTLDVYRAEARDLPEVVLVDTPGVGALDGQDDYDTAFAQVPEADLILWVAANDSHQEETTKALRALARQGKPIVMALNCSQRIDDLDGVLNGHGHLFLEFPDDPFDEADDHIRVLNGHLAAVGAPPVTVVPIHARAAFLAARGLPEAEQLRRASRIDDLIGVLRDKRANQVQLQALRVADRVREPVGTARTALAGAIPQARAQIERERSVVVDAHTRMSRAAEREEARLKAALAGPVAQRRTWHLHADVGKNLAQRWDAEAADLGRELEAEFEASAGRLRHELSGTVDAPAEARTPLTMPTLDTTHFTPLGQALLNRIATLAIALVVALGLAGLMFLAAPWSFIAFVVLRKPASRVGRRATRMVGRRFKGKGRVLLERRNQLQVSLRPMLDRLDRSARHDAGLLIGHHRSANDRWRDDRLARLATAERRVADWEKAERQLGELTGQLDLATTRTLFEVAGLPDAAAGSVRALRNAAALVVEVTEPELAEVTRPMRIAGVLPVAAVSATYSRIPWQAVDVMFQLAPGAFECVAMSADETVIEVSRPDLRDGTLDAWQSLLAEFTRCQVRLVRAPVAAPTRT